MSYLRKIEVLCAIIVTGAAGSNAVTLTNYEIPVAAVLDPHVDHTGQKIVFVGYGGGTGGSNTNVFVYNLVTTELTQLTFGIYIVANPMWSPDGSQIVFNAYGTEGNQDIWLVDADGGTPVVIVDSYYHDQQPVWSSDGDRIAYRSGVNNYEEIYILDLNSGDPPAPISISGASLIANPFWTSEGTFLFRAVPAHLFSIWEAPDSGGVAHEVIPDSAIAGVQIMDSPVANPARRAIAVSISRSTDATEPYQLWLYYRDTGNLFRIFDGDTWSASWTSTGDSLFFAGSQRLYLATDLPRPEPVPTQRTTWGTIKSRMRK